MKTRFPIRLFACAGSLILGASAFSTVALAASEPSAGPTVDPTPAIVSLSRDGLAIEAGYVVKLTNDTGNNLTWVKFTGTTDVRESGSSAQIAKVINLNSQLLTCSDVVNDENAGTSSVSCTIKSLAPGASMELVVVAKSPTAGTFIDLNYTVTLTGADANSPTGCCFASGTKFTGLVDALTDETAKSHVKSFLRPVLSGVSLFTGSSGVATSSDPWATKVVVPNFASTLLPYTTADVTESLFGNGASCSAVNLSCNRSVLTIPSLLLDTENLSITLQQHPVIIKPGSKLADWKIGYTKDTPPTSTSTYTELLYCSKTAGPAPTPGVPCINICKEYTRKTDPNFPLMQGVFECIIDAKDNGSYRPL